MTPPRAFGQSVKTYEEALEHKPGVRAALEHGKIETSIFCSADHGDGGRRRWRVAVLQKEPRRLITDGENVQWPAAPNRTVLAPCTECWRMLCEQCYAEAQIDGYCGHSRSGDWEIDVALLKSALGLSQTDIKVQSVAPLVRATH